MNTFSDGQNRRVVSLLLLVSIIFAVFAVTAIPAVSAQSPTTPSGNNTTVTNPGGNNSTGGGGWGIDLGGLLNPKKWIVGAFNGFVDMLYKGVFGFVNYARMMVSGFPAPGEYDQPSTWLNPQNGWWPEVKKASQWTMALGGVLLIVGSAMAFRIRDPYERRHRFKRIAFSWFMVVGTWVFAPLLAHFTDRLSMAVTPTTLELMDAPLKLGLGAGIAGVLAIVSTSLFAIAVVVLGIIYFLAHACIFLWPLAWGARLFDGFIESLGDTVIYTYGVIMAINVVQALILRLIYHVPFSNGSLAGPILGFVTVVGGLVFALVLFPKAMLDHANDAASFALGARAAQKGASKLGGRTQERGKQVVEQYRTSERGSPGQGDGEPNGGAPDRTTMGVGRSRSGGRRSTGRVGGGASGSSHVTSSDGGIDTRRVTEQRERIEYERAKDILGDYDDE